MDFFAVSFLMSIRKYEKFVQFVLFQDFPKEVMWCKGTSLESAFIQSIKEADQLKHKAKIVNSMKIDEHKQLWNSLLHGRVADLIL